MSSSDVLMSALRPNPLCALQRLLQNLERRAVDRRAGSSPCPTAGCASLNLISQGLKLFTCRMQWWDGLESMSPPLLRISSPSLHVPSIGAHIVLIRTIAGSFPLFFSDARKPDIYGWSRSRVGEQVMFE